MKNLNHDSITRSIQKHGLKSKTKDLINKRLPFLLTHSYGIVTPLDSCERLMV